MSDGAAIWRLVNSLEALDTNSCYLYLLLCRDFSSTSLVATIGEELVGFVTAYIPLTRPDVLFVWQIGVSPTARKRGIAKSLLRRLLMLDACRDVRRLEATVTPSNTASRRLFASLAETLGGELSVGAGFSSKDFGGAEHEAEETISIKLD